MSADNKTFLLRYIYAAAKLRDLEEALGEIGMSGNGNFQRLQGDFIKHGAETRDDILKRDGDFQ